LVDNLHESESRGVEEEWRRRQRVYHSGRICSQ
jgi:hypothetical protein